MSKIIKCQIPDRCKDCARHHIVLKGAEWADEREELCACWTNMDNTHKEGSPWEFAKDAILPWNNFKCSPIPRRYVVEEYNEQDCTKVTYWNSLEEARYYAHDTHYARVIDRSAKEVVAVYGELLNTDIITDPARYWES